MITDLEKILVIKDLCCLYNTIKSELQLINKIIDYINNTYSSSVPHIIEENNNIKYFIDNLFDNLTEDQLDNLQKNLR